MDSTPAPDQESETEGSAETSRRHLKPMPDRTTPVLRRQTCQTYPQLFCVCFFPNETRSVKPTGAGVLEGEVLVSELLAVDALTTGAVAPVIVR